ncbi:HvfC/BufC family peptide modification chaperone [Agaribacter flavus]|uniref:DNA-binding domain-containing protein n=1 Tax=Agaribacter flavus TaxID=1902781 RepID=A0ABV7FPK0_9ALTE
MDYQTTLVNSIVMSSSHQTPLAAMKVYRNNYIENGIRALSITYSTLANIMGEEGFRQLAAAYLAKHHKIVFDWADFGAEMAEFLLDQDITQSSPFLFELARYDWAKQQTERSKNTTVDVDSFSLLSTSPASDVVFVAAYGLQRVDYFFPMMSFQQLANLSESPDTALEKKNILNALKKEINDAINLDKPRSFVLWREQYKAELMPVDELSKKAFDAMLQGQSVEAVLSNFGDAEEQMSNWLQTCIAKQQICAVKPTHS